MKLCQSQGPPVLSALPVRGGQRYRAAHCMNVVRSRTITPEGLVLSPPKKTVRWAFCAVFGFFFCSLDDKITFSVVLGGDCFLCF